MDTARGFVLVTGATGKNGRRLCAELEARGLPYRRAVRHVSQANDTQFDFLDPGSWRPALEGAESIFLLRPPAIARTSETIEPFLDLARSEGVRQIVFLSVAGAERNRLLPHASIERRLMGGAKDWTILRPGFFAQNLEDAYLADLRDDSRLYLPAGNGKVAFVDLRDVAEVAVNCLVDPAAHQGEAYHLTGPIAATFHEVARCLADVLKRDIVYVPASIAGYARHLRARGAPWGLVAVQTYLHVGLRFGQAEGIDPTLERLLGRRGRSVFDYISDHREIWSH